MADMESPSLADTHYDYNMPVTSTCLGKANCRQTHHVFEDVSNQTTAW